MNNELLEIKENNIETLENNLLPCLNEKSLGVKNGKSLALQSILSYNNEIRNFRKFLKDKTYSNLEELMYHIALFIEDAKNINVSRIRKSAIKQSLIKMYDGNLSKRIEILQAFSVIKTGVVIPNIKNRALTKEQVKKLICEANEKMAVIIKVLYITGLRINELTNLEHKRIKKNGAFFDMVVIGKGKKQRSVAITESLYFEVIKLFPKIEETKLFIYCNQTYKRGADKNGRIKRLLVHTKPFQYKNAVISTKLDKIGKRVINRRLSAHDFRHSFATNKIKDGKALKAVSRYLGHSSTAITNDYYVDASLENVDILDNEIEELKGKEKVGRGKAKKKIEN